MITPTPGADCSTTSTRPKNKYASVQMVGASPRRASASDAPPFAEKPTCSESASTHSAGRLAVRVKSIVYGPVKPSMGSHVPVSVPGVLANGAFATLPCSVVAKPTVHGIALRCRPGHAQDGRRKSLARVHCDTGTSILPRERETTSASR